MKKAIYTALVFGLLIGTMLIARHIKTLNNQIEFKQIQLKDNSTQLKLLDSKYDQLNKELGRTGSDKAKVEQQLKDLQIERDKLQADLQAKKEQKAKDLAVRTTQAVGAPQTAYASTGNCEPVRQIMASKGFSGAELNAAVQLAQLESGCRTNNNNPSSNACNYYQEWPCGKWGGNSNTDAHINGAIGYMQASYGTWQNAVYKWHQRSPHWW